jgi:hypothetical protein
MRNSPGFAKEAQFGAQPFRLTGQIKHAFDPSQKVTPLIPALFC